MKKTLTGYRKADWLGARTLDVITLKPLMTLYRPLLETIISQEAHTWVCLVHNKYNKQTNQ